MEEELAAAKDDDELLEEALVTLEWCFDHLGHSEDDVKNQLSPGALRTLAGARLSSLLLRSHFHVLFPTAEGVRCGLRRGK
jgi:hypothetical protein